jgi:hypothetical protein
MKAALLPQHPEGLEVRESPHGVVYAVRPIRYGRMENGWKHRFVDIDVLSLPMNAGLVLEPGELQVTKLINANPQPIGWAGRVTWDGDETRPCFMLTDYPEFGDDEMPVLRFRVEVTGS